MEQRARSLEGELQASSAQVSDLKHKLDDVRKESMTDPLTGIANRKALDAAAKQAMEAVAADGEDVTLLLCDIDHFKKFNDSWGHQTGDQVLRLVASCLSENVKGRDTAARYGGEEFAVVLRGVGLDAATRVADQIRETVETKKLIKRSTGDVLGTITISIGVANFAPGETVETVVRRADACLYGAKHSGRNMVINQNDARMAALETSAA
jgi:diguanylate cyclase